MSFFFLPRFDYINLLQRESALSTELGIKFDRDRPWVEFELLERSIDEENARQSDSKAKEMEQQIQSQSTTTVEGGIEVPLFNV